MCVGNEMQKLAYQQQDFRNATDAIMKQCEPVLTKMREVYTDAEVPGVIADRHLKQMRLQNHTRGIAGHDVFLKLRVKRAINHNNN